MADSSLEKQPNQTLDCIGLYCPMPVINTKDEMDSLAVGEVLEVLADDPAAEEDLKAWAKWAGQEMITIEKTDEGKRFLIRKTK